MLKIILTGNLGTDAEVRTLDNGNAAISFSVAHTERWKDAGGNQQERTTWVKCVRWSKADKTGLAQFLKKGTKVLIEGVPTTSGWLNNKGEVMSDLNVRVDNLEFLSSPPKDNNQPLAAVAPAPYTPANVLPAQQAAPTAISFAKREDEDDLPF